MGWMGVEMNTLTDKSNSKIAELMIQGTNMGIIEGVKLLNHNPDTCLLYTSIVVHAIFSCICNSC